MPSSALNLSQHQVLFQLFTSGGQNTGASASASVLPTSIQDWFPLRLTGLISLLSKGLSEVFSSTTVWRHQSLAFCLLYSPALKTIYVTTGKTIALTLWTFVSRVMSLLFNTWSRFVITFLPRSNHLLILWLLTVCSDFGAQQEEICHYFHLFF